MFPMAGLGAAFIGRRLTGESGSSRLFALLLLGLELGTTTCQQPYLANEQPPAIGLLKK